MDERSWHDELTALVARGRNMLGDHAVAEALATASGALGPSEPVRFLPPAPVLGVTSCASGWVGVAVDTTGRAGVHVASTLTALVESVRRAGEVAVVAVDVGIGSAERNQVEAWLGTRPTVVAIGVRAALSSARAGGSVSDAGLVPPPFYDGQGFDEGNLEAACAAAWSAGRHAGGDSEPVGSPDQVTDPTPFAELLV